MIKAIFTALTGITEDIDSEESQDAWERRRYADEHDLDDDGIESDAKNDDDDDTRNKGWFALW
ncbi:MAG: hypothetical protein AUK48_14625 [Oscillatoriales cyanobacterium CG2_30_44_21]|nr:MAG: hypothetical protein AUK48_14625 [Oscillatoriales cyanobacterium CG2_30_44_21]